MTSMKRINLFHRHISYREFSYRQHPWISDSLEYYDELIQTALF